MPVEHAEAPRTARAAVAAFFALAGIAMGSWVARIPAVQTRLALDPGALGLALLGISVGAVLAMPSSGWLIARWGSRRIVETAGLAACALLILPPLAPSGLLLWLALAAFGAAYGVLDVSMNTQAAAVETRYGRPIMSSFHGVFSVGGLAGAASAGFIASRGVGPGPHLFAVAVILAAMALVARRQLLPPAADAASGGPAFARPSRALAGLGAIAFCVLLAEGAIGDWSAVYLTSVLGAAAGVGAAGYAAFSLTMAAGRFAGDGLAERFGPVGVARSGGVLIALGMALTLLVDRPVLAIAGFAVAGVGMAGLFPVALTAAGRTPGVPPATAIAAVATLGYLGFLAGPPAIGMAAQAAGLRVGLTLIVALGIAVTLLARSVAAGPNAAPAAAAPAAAARAVEDLA
ncbi:MAG TPA: MFS transporter [Thermomicrobiales bacterium]|nr:MFS transporter [Thermomicrobiales bacterium]